MIHSSRTLLRAVTVLFRVSSIILASFFLPSPSALPAGNKSSVLLLLSPAGLTQAEHTAFSAELRAAMLRIDGISVMLREDLFTAYKEGTIPDAELYRMAGESRAVRVLECVITPRVQTIEKKGAARYSVIVQERKTLHAALRLIDPASRVTISSLVRTADDAERNALLAAVTDHFAPFFAPPGVPPHAVRENRASWATALRGTMPLSRFADYSRSGFGVAAAYSHGLHIIPEDRIEAELGADWHVPHDGKIDSLYGATLSAGWFYRFHFARVTLAPGARLGYQALFLSGTPDGASRSGDFNYFNPYFEPTILIIPAHNLSVSPRVSLAWRIIFEAESPVHALVISAGILF